MNNSFLLCSVRFRRLFLRIHFLEMVPYLRHPQRLCAILLINSEPELMREFWQDCQLHGWFSIITMVIMISRQISIPPLSVCSTSLEGVFIWLMVRQSIILLIKNSQMGISKKWSRNSIHVLHSSINTQLNRVIELEFFSQNFWHRFHSLHRIMEPTRLYGIMLLQKTLSPKKHFFNEEVMRSLSICLRIMLPFLSR